MMFCAKLKLPRVMKRKIVDQIYLPNSAIFSPMTRSQSFLHKIITPFAILLKLVQSFKIKKFKTFSVTDICRTTTSE